MPFSANETLRHLPLPWPADRAELQALITNRNTPRKVAWRADIVLATADGLGTFAIMFGRLKAWRRVATRYDRCPKVFLSAIALAATAIYWLWVPTLVPA